MKKIVLISSTFILLIVIIFFGWWFLQKPSKAFFRHVSFKQLPGWEEGAFQKSMETFQISCRAFVKQDPDKIVGTDKIELRVKDWLPACQAALGMNTFSEKQAKHFFQTWFDPVEFYEGKPVKGLFTGYYMPLIKGSLEKTSHYNVPLYQVPSNLITAELGTFAPDLKNRKIVGRLEGKKLVPFYTREQINHGAIKKTAKILLWIHSPVDRLFLEIQGSGIIELDDAKQIIVGYDGQNGAPYTAVAGVLIKKGIMTKHNASMQGIKRYLEAHPKQMDPVINQNKSFVFFRKLPIDAALGSQGVALTPGYSMAIDKQWIPMGAPIWLSTSRPDSTDPNKNKPMNRLMVAQDTGGAIKGKVRGDVYWGGGDKATAIAGHMKNEGHYWLLLPRHALSRLESMI